MRPRNNAPAQKCDRAEMRPRNNAPAQKCDRAEMRPRNNAPWFAVFNNPMEHRASTAPAQVMRPRK